MAVTFDDVLAHYGVRGMKWGVRRGRSESAPASEDVKKARVAASKVTKKGGTSALTNQELQTLVTRMNLERQFSTLTSQSKGQGKLAKGQKFTKAALGVGSTANQAIAFANSPAGKLLKSAFNEASASRGYKKPKPIKQFAIGK